jgi:hypothetical protein
MEGGQDMLYEDPSDLLRRLRLGREEFCQRLVTTLILGGTYPRWNTRSTPTTEGKTFLRLFDELSFGEATPPDADVFVDELELRPRVESEQGGAPDWAVVWPHRLWLIELKTERASHRPHQLPYYFELGSHHFPGRPVDITYLTGPLSKPAPSTKDGQRYTHLTWDQVVPLVAEVWGGSNDAAVVRLVDALNEATAALDQRWSDWRTAFVSAPVGEQVWPTPDDLMPLIAATAQDGEQRALGAQVGSLEDLQALRLEARELIRESSPDSGLRRVMPWIWSGKETTTGEALTSAGAQTGFELRFSRYQRPVY